MMILRLHIKLQFSISFSKFPPLFLVNLTITSLPVKLGYGEPEVISLRVGPVICKVMASFFKLFYQFLPSSLEGTLF